MRSLLAISAGLSQPSSSRRLADMLAEATRAKIAARGEGAEIDVIEVHDLAFELATAMTDQTAQTPLLASPMPSTTFPPSSQLRPVLRATPSFWTTHFARYLTNSTQTSCRRVFFRPQKT